MKRLYIYCEGQTEEYFIRTVLYPYLFSFNIVVKPIICETKRTENNKFKGGIRDFNKIKHGTMIADAIGIEEISNKCKHFGKWVSKITALSKKGTS